MSIIKKSDECETASADEEGDGLLTHGQEDKARAKKSGHDGKSAKVGDRITREAVFAGIIHQSEPREQSDCEERANDGEGEGGKERPVIQ